VKLSRYRHAGAKEEKYSAYSFFTSVLDGDGGQSHASAVLRPRKGIPITHRIGGWVGIRGGVEAEARGKNSVPLLGIEPCT
jgi:hypothetical protein